MRIPLDFAKFQKVLSRRLEGSQPGQRPDRQGGLLPGIDGDVLDALSCTPLVHRPVRVTTSIYGFLKHPEGVFHANAIEVSCCLCPEPAVCSFPDSFY